ncbi:TetR/AcrR family transcriptional regulator [Demequina capsici]|uniref:Helix-turn-helix domain-containing protein n=1 Tax=Demequina capsici TaxID=3075620 RepID=A0AA96F3Y1_9MICO|nr:helix-turn-helix domain-containing protein [Demequina sp. OYTSA14]WNM23571.1 helix-turn-helix domain-containing protein [Demequina sp. OYTSA14]
MGRWVAGAPGRLALAALELFAERGYDATTVADIAERAGLTERTFFRHYPAKRDVLFGGDSALNADIRASVLAAPHDASPLDLALAGVAPLREHHDANKEAVRRREAVVASHADLIERDLAKRATLVATITAALVERGVDLATAEMVTSAVGQAFATAVRDWLQTESEGEPLGALMNTRLRALADALAA